MKILNLLYVSTITLYLSASPAAAVTIPDQVQPDWATNQYGASATLNWQEEVTAGVSGKLTTVQLWSGQTTTGSVSINVGSGWQTDANEFTGTITGMGGTNWSSVDVSSANIMLNAGDKFTIGFNGNSVMGVWGSFHSTFTDYPRGALYVNAGVIHPNMHFAFRTFMDVAPPPVPLDVIQPVANLGFSGLSSFTWQQEVTALTSGTLEGFDLWTTNGNSGTVFINLGSGWQTDANDFNGTISGVADGWSHVDVSAANISVTAGQKFVVGFNGNSALGVLGSQLNGDQYAQGRLYVNGSEQANLDLGFRTYVAAVVPEPSALVLAVCGAIGLLVVASRRRARHLVLAGPRQPSTLLLAACGGLCMLAVFLRRWRVTWHKA
jgi:hypothetical protein